MRRHSRGYRAMSARRWAKALTDWHGMRDKAVLSSRHCRVCLVPGPRVLLLVPIWIQFSSLLPSYTPTHPIHQLGRRQRAIPDRVVIEYVFSAHLHGSCDERIASSGTSTSLRSLSYFPHRLAKHTPRARSPRRTHY
jgi:hypothetical protein